PQRLAAVADGILLGTRELRGGAVLAGRHEHRVIAEATAPARGVRDVPLPGPLRNERRTVPGASQPHDDALVACLAKAIRHLVQLGEQLAQVLLIARTFPGKARRPHPGSPNESIHLDPGIVGERRQVCVARGVARLQQRILEEGRAGLGGGPDAEFRLGNQLHREWREQVCKLAQLPRVGAGENRACHGASSAWLCSAKSSAIPAAARLSSASSSWRLKAWPSAVPWISMNAPPLFITTFMSVSACESSA